jgi:hypothetical protein
MEEISNSLVRNHGRHGGIHAARASDDGDVVNGRLEGFNALRNEFLSVKHLKHRR